MKTWQGMGTGSRLQVFNYPNVWIILQFSKEQILSYFSEWHVNSKGRISYGALETNGFVAA